MRNWGTVEDRDETGKFIAYHVVPLVEIDGEAIMSGAHEVSATCSCNPVLDRGRGGWNIWLHHDPDHHGALTDAEWEQKKNHLTPN